MQELFGGLDNFCISILGRNRIFHHCYNCKPMKNFTYKSRESLWSAFYIFFFTIATAFKMSAPGNNQCNYKSYQTAKLQNKSIFNFILFKNRPKSISYEIKILEPGPKRWCARSINKILLPSYYLKNVRRMFAMISRNICIRPSVTPTIFREAKFQLFNWKNPAKHSGCLL